MMPLLVMTNFSLEFVRVGYIPGYLTLSSHLYLKHHKHHYGLMQRHQPKQNLGARSILTKPPNDLAVRAWHLNLRE